MLPAPQIHLIHSIYLHQLYWGEGRNLCMGEKNVFNRVNWPFNAQKQRTQL